MPTDLSTWLLDQRKARGWTRPELARQLIQAGRTRGDRQLPSADSMCRNIYRWERGGPISERYKLHYCHAFGIQLSQFGPTDGPSQQAGGTAVVVSPDRAVLADEAAGQPGAYLLPVPASSPLSLHGGCTYRGIYQPDLGASTIAREVLMAAHEGSDHADQTGQPGIGDATFEQLRADVTRLAHLTGSGEPFAVFLELRRVRERIYRLLNRRVWPREQTDLYFLLACVNGIMGSAANQLGYPDAAEELQRAAWAYANVIDHRPLMAWSRGELSVFAYYRGRFEESRDLALSGLQYLSVGSPGAALHIYHARAAGRIGDADTALQAVREAHEARDRDYNNDLLEIGGNFAISEATHFGMTGGALTATAGAEREAMGDLERAIGLYDRGPGEREEYWFGGKPLAGIDLAMVRLRSGALDGADTALQPALSLAAAQRISDVTIRLSAVREELAAPIFRGSTQARDLGAQIEEYGRETVAAGLHSLPGPG